MLLVIKPTVNRSSSHSYVHVVTHSLLHFACYSMPSLLRRLFAFTNKFLCLPLNSFRSSFVPQPPLAVHTMDITHATFPQELIKIIQHIADSRFIAFDLEFSGVAARRQGGGSGRFTLQEYYHDLRSAAQIYQILQIGLTIVNEDTKKGKLPDLELPSC